jgi:hypothetical protein
VEGGAPSQRASLRRYSPSLRRKGCSEGGRRRGKVVGIEKAGQGGGGGAEQCGHTPWLSQGAGQLQEGVQEGQAVGGVGWCLEGRRRWGRGGF